MSLPDSWKQALCALQNQEYLQIEAPLVTATKAWQEIMFAWWPGLDKEIEDLAKSYLTCQSIKHAPAAAPLHPWVWLTKPWPRIHMDLAGLFMGKSFSQNSYGFNCGCASHFKHLWPFRVGVIFCDTCLQPMDSQNKRQQTMGLNSHQRSLHLCTTTQCNTHVVHQITVGLVLIS